jgi:hypothetical protein
MKIKLVTMAALASLLLTQCTKETISPVLDEKVAFLQRARQFVQTQAPVADFAQMDWDRAVAYKQDSAYKMVRVPLRGHTQPGQKAVYLGYNNGQFRGNYFELSNNTVTTLSLDNVHKRVGTINGQGQVRDWAVYENGQPVQDVTGMAIGIMRPPIQIVTFDLNYYYWIDLLLSSTGASNAGNGSSGGITANYLDANPDGSDVIGGGTIVSFSEQVYELVTPLGLYYEQALWLQSNLARAEELRTYLQASTNPLANTIGLEHLKRMMADPGYLSFVQQYAATYNGQPMWWENSQYLEPFGGTDFGDWAIHYLIQYPMAGMANFRQQFMPATFIATFDYSNLNNPVLVNDDPVQMPMGFDFKFENFSTTTAPPSRVIGKTDPRGNTEDMQSGTNGDVAGILSNMPNFTSQQLFNEMEDLFHKTSVGVLETVGDQMIARFRNNMGGSYYNADLSQKVFESSSFKNFIIKFGIRLHAALSRANWNINNVDTIVMPQSQRPAFNGLYNKINGLQILINDTEETIIELTGFSINAATHKWTAKLNITIKDHFGLDKEDALEYQNSHAGFAAWWLLQHTRGHKPFETVVQFNMDLISD